MVLNSKWVGEWVKEITPGGGGGDHPTNQPNKQTKLDPQLVQMLILIYEILTEAMEWNALF